jgi:hypothetical protein
MKERFLEILFPEKWGKADLSETLISNYRATLKMEVSWLSINLPKWLSINLPNCTAPHLKGRDFSNHIRQNLNFAVTAKHEFVSFNIRPSSFRDEMIPGTISSCLPSRNSDAFPGRKSGRNVMLTKRSANTRTRLIPALMVVNNLLPVNREAV